MRRTMLALAVLTLALSACELRAEIAVDDDGSGTVGMVFAVEPEMMALFDQSGFGGDPFADLRADLADDPVAWSVDEFREGRLTGIRATFAFASVEDLLDKMEALDSDQGNEAALEDFALERQAGGWTFRGNAGDPQEELASGGVPISIEQLAALLKVQFRVTLPGRTADHNADEAVYGGGRTTFVWRPDLRSEGLEMRAATTPGGASSPVLPVAVVALLVLIIAGVWFLRTRAPSPQPEFSLPSEVVSDVVGVRPPDPPQEDASFSS